MAVGSEAAHRFPLLSKQVVVDLVLPDAPDEDRLSHHAATPVALLLDRAHRSRIPLEDGGPQAPQTQLRERVVDDEVLRLGAVAFAAHRFGEEEHAGHRPAARPLDPVQTDRSDHLLVAALLDRPEDVARRLLLGGDHGDPLPLRLE